MPKYEHSMSVQAPRDTVFDVLLDVSNLPKLFPCVETAEPRDNDRVYVRGQGFAFEFSMALVDVLRRLEWSVSPDWSGWLEVDGDDDAGVARVRAMVSYPQGSTHQLIPGTASDSIPRDVSDLLPSSLTALKQLVESRAAIAG